MERRQTPQGVEIRLERTGIARSTLGPFFILFGAFFAGIPMFMLVMIWLIAGGDLPLLPKLGITAFVSLFIVVGLTILSAGLLDLFGAHVVIIKGREIRAGKKLGPIHWLPKMKIDERGSFSIRPASSSRDALAGVHQVVFLNAFGVAQPIVRRASEPDAQQLASALTDEIGLAAQPLEGRSPASQAETLLEQQDESLAKRQSDYELPVAEGQMHWKVVLAIAIALDTVVVGVLVTIFLVNGKLPWVGMIVGGVFFAVVTALLVAGILGAMAASKLGPPTLSLSVHPVLLGESFTLSLEQPVKASGRHEGVTATLFMRESAEYQRGTNRYTVTHDTFKQRVEIIPPGALVPGQNLAGTASFEIPTNAMHSFEAKNNKIKWIIKVQTVLKGWPDFRRSFELEVFPRAYVDTNSS